MSCCTHAHKSMARLPCLVTCHSNIALHTVAVWARMLNVMEQNRAVRPERALELCVAMRKQWLAPGVIASSASIGACEKGKQPERASALHEAMQMQWLAPDSITSSAPVSAWEKGTRPERALELVKAMRKHQLAPDVITFNASISACEEGMRPERAWQPGGGQEKALEGARGMLLGVIRTHHSQCIDLRVRAGREARVNVGALRGDAGAVAVARRRHLQRIDQRAGQGVRPERASGLFDAVQEQWLTPDVFTYYASVRACEQGVGPARALELYVATWSQWLTPGVVTYSALLRARAEGVLPVGALGLFVAMQKQRLPLVVFTYHASISACEKNMRPE